MRLLFQITYNYFRSVDETGKKIAVSGYCGRVSLDSVSNPGKAIKPEKEIFKIN
jgi:hypothetical protein